MSVNTSKVRESRFWKRWANSGAVDFSLRAKKMGCAIFGYDPIIGCPFDDSEMKMVESHENFTIGTKVCFRGPNKLGTMDFPRVKGKIIAIGENAKYSNGEPFTVLAIQVGSKIFFKHGGEVSLL